MIDLYLHAPTMADLAAGLSIVGLAADGDLIPASHQHALVVIADDADGVTVAVRCLDDDLADAIRATSLTEVSKPEGWSWAS